MVIRGYTIKMDNFQLELGEFVLLNNSASELETDSEHIQQHSNIGMKWASNNTKMLIHLYSVKKKDVGTWKIKSIKIMWQQICEALNNTFKLNLTPSQCENRWRVLERGYKKFIDNNNSTGRGRKYFEFENEMNEVFGKRKNVFPELLLSSTTTDVSPMYEELQLKVDDSTKRNTNEQSSSKKRVAQSEKEITTPKTKRRRPNAIENIKKIKKDYYDKRLEIEKEKLVEIRQRNNLINERNEILREKNIILKEKNAIARNF